MRLALLCLTVWMIVVPAMARAGPPDANSESPAVDVERVSARIVAQASDPRSLTLEAAVDEAMARNLRIVALRREFDALRHRPEQARSLAAPTFEAQIWQWPVNTANPANTTMYMLMFGQDVPGRGKRALRSSLLEMDVELAAAAIAIAARDVIDRVERVYADLFLARRELEVHHATVRLLRQLVDLSDVKYRTGRISQQDVLKAVVEVSKIQEHLIVLDEREQLAAAELNTLLDRSVADAVGPLATPAERVVLPPVSELQRLALAQQPDLKAAVLEVTRAEAALGVVRSEYRPDFSVMGGYMLMPGQRDSWMAQVGITWPTAPWTKSSVDAKAAEATASVAAARARSAAVASATREAVYTAHVRVQAASRRVSLLRTTIVPQSEQTLEVARVGYQTDQVDFLVLIDHQRLLLDTQIDYLRALNDLERARAALKRAVGTDITSVPARETSVTPSDMGRALR